MNCFTENMTNPATISLGGQKRNVYSRRGGWWIFAREENKTFFRVTRAKVISSTHENLASRISHQSVMPRKT